MGKETSVNCAARVAMTAIFSAAAGIAVVLPINAARASVIAQDNFNYTAGQSIVGQNGGTGWSGAWYHNSGGYIFGNATIGGNSLNYAGIASSGGAVAGQAGGISRGSTDGRALAAASNTHGGVIWLSMEGVLQTDGYGFPNLRLLDNGALTGGIGGNGSFGTGFLTVWSLLNSNLWASGAAMSGTALSSSVDLALMEINYQTDTTTLWMNPKVSTFDGTQAPSATLNDAPVFNAVGLFLRGGDAVDALTIATTSWEALQQSGPVSAPQALGISAAASAPVPEPSSIAMLGSGLLGLLGLGGFLRRRRA